MNISRLYLLSGKDFIQVLFMDTFTSFNQVIVLLGLKTIITVEETAAVLFVFKCSYVKFNLFIHNPL